MTTNNHSLLENLPLDAQILLNVLIVLFVTFVVVSLFKLLFNRFIHKRVQARNIDTTTFVFGQKLITGIIYVVGFAIALTQIPEMKIVGHSLLAGAGVISLVAGLASQQGLSNVMSGFFIVLFRPFSVNDKITFDNFYGTVEEINLRHVVLKDLENNRIIVPNSVISSKVIINNDLSETTVCKHIEVGIGYSADINKALAILQDEIAKHPNFVDNRSPIDIVNEVPQVVARVVALADSSVNLKAWAYAADTSKAFSLHCDVLKSLKERFDNEGIEIPYNYQNVVIKNS